MTDAPTLTPFQRRALTEAARLSAGSRTSTRCFRAQDLSRALWPDSPAWQRHSNNGPGGSTVGQGIKRAAGKPLRLLADKGLVRNCLEQHYGYTCNGYYVTAAGRALAALDGCWECAGTAEACTAAPVKCCPDCTHTAAAVAAPNKEGSTP